MRQCWALNDLRVILAAGRIQSDRGGHFRGYCVAPVPWPTAFTAYLLNGFEKIAYIETLIEFLSTQTH